MRMVSPTYLKIDVSGICIEIVLIRHDNLRCLIKNIRIVEMNVRRRFNSCNDGDIVIAETGLNRSCECSEGTQNHE